MSFLAPLFLLGAGLVALPIWLHLRRETTDESREVPSLMFFRDVREPVAARLRVRAWLLLLLRIALLLALCASFAKPVLDGAISGALAGVRTHHLVAVDTSLSMRCCGRFDEARARIDEIAEAAPAGDVLHVFALGDGDFGPALEPGEVGAAIARLSPGVRRLEYGAAVAELSRHADRLRERLLPSRPNDRVALHLVSDFQASAAPARFSDLVPSDAALLRLHAVGSAGDTNGWIDAARFETESEGRVRIFARARGAGTQDQERTVRLFVEGELRGETPAQIPAQGSVAVSFDDVDVPPGDVRVRLELAPADALPEDDRTYVIVRSSERQRVRIVAAGSGPRSELFVETALQAATGAGAPILLQSPPASRPLDAADTDVAIVLDAARDEQLERALGTFVASGGRVLRILEPEPLGDLRREGFTYVRSAAHEEPARAIPIPPHALLRDTAGWSSVRLFAYAAIPEPGRVVLRSDAGHALLRETPDGGLLLGIPLDPVASDLALQPLFVPFLVNAIALLGAGPDELDRTYTVGAPLLLGDGPAQVFAPGGRSELGLAGMGGRVRSLVLRELGFYEWTRGEQTFLLAVNPDPRESDVAPLEETALARWREALAAGPAGAAPSPPAAASSRSAEGTPYGDAGAAPGPEGAPAAVASRAPDSGHPLWVPILAILVVLSVAESVLGNRQLSARPESTT